MVDFKSPPPFKKSPPCLISKPAAFFSKPAGFFSEADRVFFDPFYAFLSGLSCSFPPAVHAFFSNVRVSFVGISCLSQWTFMFLSAAVHTFFSSVRVSFVGISCLSERTFMFLSATVRVFSVVAVFVCNLSTVVFGYFIVFLPAMPSFSL
ncbi:hypothetical protein [Bacteroides pyogenes]|uniref:hypothetical protein n=1 Tax=Bacteroides pyogenes TaxID=310300 RepID=UPI0005526BBD|nr:hypothetical protein [Bacteroides pyogenes]MBB3894282.1 hypothetical protein [Bacteroides pyogenes]